MLTDKIPKESYISSKNPNISTKDGRHISSDNLNYDEILDPDAIGK